MRQRHAVLYLSLALALVVGVLIPNAQPLAAASAVGPTAQFVWKMADRFGELDANGFIRARHDPDYVNPAAGYEVDLDATSSVPGSAPITSYLWTIAWTTGSGGHITVQASTPTSSVGLAQGHYDLTLAVTAQDGQTQSTTQSITVKDILIISIGDSYASGEGNPLEPQKFDVVGCRSREAVWGDTGDDPDCVRCHRSVLAGPAQAALQVEQADPHTSVTFVSFACSGAQVSVGLLQPYPGIETPPGTSNLPPIPAQIDQVRDFVQGRPIDALVISIGGNDAGFSKIIKACVLNKDCQFDQSVYQGFANDLASLPFLYSNLAGAIANKLPPIESVYVTEYPDPTRDDNGDFCTCMLCDVLHLFGLFGLSAVEAQWCSDTVLPGINGKMLDSAVAFGWSYVTGISSQYLTHGYCASDHWIRTMSESMDRQGPTQDPTAAGVGVYCLTQPIPIVRETQGLATTGGAHPNEKGHLAYARQIAEAIMQPGPAYTPVAGTLGIGDQRGDNGWWTGTCVPFGGCSSDEVLLSVLIEDSDGVDQNPPPSLRVDGNSGCPFADQVSCGYQILAPDTKVGWFLHIRGDGVHHIIMSARDKRLKVTNFSYEIKVDLHDPAASPPVVSGTPAPSPGWYRSPVDVSLGGLDSPGGSGVARIEYRLDAAALVTVPGANANVHVAGEARHTLAFEVVDNAGRRSGPWTTVIGIDATPPVLNVPAEVVEIASSAGGALVSFSVIATDNVDRSPIVSCVPASGSQFPIGATTVMCTATDAAGNKSSKTFLVRVKGAAEQATDLASVLKALGIMAGLKNALGAKLSAVLAHIASGEDRAACGELGAFISQVEAQLGKQLTAAEASDLTKAAKRIRAVLGCDSPISALGPPLAPPDARAGAPAADETLPSEVILFPARPTPFTTQTAIAFALPQPCYVQVNIFDLAGRLVVNLADGWQSSGRHQVTWDGIATGGTRLKPGVYLCRLTAGNVLRTGRAILLPHDH